MNNFYFCIVYIYMYFCRAIQCPVVADWRVLKPLWPCSSKSFKVIGQACRLISFHCSGSRARTGFGSGSGSPNIGLTPLGAAGYSHSCGQHLLFLGIGGRGRAPSRGNAVHASMQRQFLGCVAVPRYLGSPEDPKRIEK